MNFFPFVVQTARESFTYSPEADPSALAIESLTIACCRITSQPAPVILDLQPVDMVKAIAAVEARIGSEYPHFHTTGWRGASDGIRLYFTAWTSR